MTAAELDVLLRVHGLAELIANDDANLAQTRQRPRFVPAYVVIIHAPSGSCLRIGRFSSSKSVVCDAPHHIFRVRALCHCGRLSWNWP
jgi:hypothetical protein